MNKPGCRKTVAIDTKKKRPGYLYCKGIAVFISADINCNSYPSGFP